jgi:crotonobetainyl-CoA:carnitine CoA-transferase CaiB-like acyl-CoA transferase
MAGVYEGLRVLDLSWGIAGPMTTMLLADNGARVTRIERPGGDPIGEQSGDRVWHRGKRRATLDLKSSEGKDAFRSLARSADIVVESFSPGTTSRLGIDYDTLRSDNPGLIYCSITGYGRDNSHSDRPGYDALVAARTGLFYDQKGRRGTAMEYIAGRPGPHPEFDGPEGLRRGTDRKGPVFPRSTWPSLGATYLASLGIAAALRARAVTGEGQWVETSLLRGVLFAAGLNWQRVENPDAPLYWMWPIDSRSIEGLYECADGRWVHHWTVRPSWVFGASEGEKLDPVPPDMKYRDDPDRLSMEPEGMLSGIFLHPLLADAFKKYPSAEWEKAGEESQMGVALVRSPAEALADEAYIVDGCVVEVDDPELGRIRHAGTVLEFSDTPGQVQGPTVPAGIHTAEVLAEAQSPPARTDSPALGGVLAHPLDGVRVLDLGLGVAGPFAPRMLADLGADVIKVHAVYDTYWAGTHMGLGTNRGKRSIAINLKDPRGREIMERLVEKTDVLATNWRPGAAARLGLDFETLHCRFPRLVYCNTRGYERGPRSALPGTDQTAAALTGPEWEDGACDAGNPPMWSRSNMGDTGNAMLAAIAVTAALYHRDRTGVGQAVSTSIVNAGLLNTSYAWIHADGTPGDWLHVDREQYGVSPFYRLYRTDHDGWIFVAAVTPDERAAFADVVGNVANARTWTATRSAAACFGELDAAGVPVEIVDEEFCRKLFDDPEARAQQLIAQTWAGGVGRFEDPGLLIHLSGTPGVIGRGPCLCGEHTREILLEHGYADDEIDKLVTDRVVRDEPVARPAQ